MRPLFLLLVLALPSVVSAIEVKDVNPRDRAVHVRYDPGNEEFNSFIDVFGFSVSRGMLDYEVIDLEPGHLIFIGPPGTYKVSGSEKGKRVSKLVTIVDSGNPKPPKPDDDKDKDEDEDEDSDPDDDNQDDDTKPKDWPETKYDVGPEISWAFRNAKDLNAVASIFEKASIQAQQVKKPVNQIAAELKSSLLALTDKGSSEGCKVYRKLFATRHANNRINKIGQFEEAFAEVAFWIRKREGK